MNYQSSKNIILASYITGLHDVNRNETLENGNIAPIKAWLDSIVFHNMQAVVFHNSISPNDCKLYEANILFVHVNPIPKYGTNVMRYFFYQQFLNENVSIENLFFTDITDVLLLKNPFIQTLFANNKNTIFCGDEPTTLNNIWMQNHNASYRSQIKDFNIYEENFKEATLLNCGIVGGNVQIIKPLIDSICQIHKQFNANNKTAYTGDMGAFNYVLRTQFNNNIMHGSPVNTVFKKYETNNNVCWFSHK